MSEQSQGGVFRVEAGVGRVRPSDELSDQPFHVALLGDFSARSTRGEAADSSALPNRTPFQIDRDDLEAVLARLRPALTVALPESGEEALLSFAELDDFHPDRLIDHPRLFGALKEKRNEIADPAGFARFKAKLQEVDSTPPPRIADDSPAPVDSGNLLDQILDDGPSQAPATALEDGGLQDFVKRVVAPHAVPAPDATQAELLAQLDEQIASRMRWVLHRPEFQALEALWRAVSLLCRRVETSSTLKLFLIDVSKDELLSELNSDTPLEESGLYRLLVESSVGTPGAVPWSLLVGCYSFGPGMADMKLLSRLGAMAHLASAPWLSAAEPSLLGCPSFEAAPDPDDWDEPDNGGWDAIRLLPYAGHLGLVLPRFLLRLPYGRDTDECDRLAFEEMPEALAEHEEYLWGNSALLCALLIARAFSAQGRDLRLGGNLEIDKLPLHLHKADGEVVAQPCAETLLTERALMRISDRGLMALASLKDRDSVRLLRFQSVADPPTSLNGPWL